jgi:hypothetical protein
MIKRSTWVLLSILILVIATYFIIKANPSKSIIPTPTVAGDVFLVTQSDGVLQSLRILDRENHTFQMQRDLSKTWVITAPTSGVADQALASAAETQVGALRIVASLDPSPEAGSVGLIQPSYILELGFVNGLSHKIEVGDLTPTSSGYYVQYDGARISVISQSGIDALLKMLTAPPFPATATPLPTAKMTTTPSPQTTLQSP